MDKEKILRWGNGSIIIRNPEIIKGKYEDEQKY